MALRIRKTNNPNGKCCAPSFPVTLLSPFPPSLVFSSPLLPESPLNVAFKKKEPNLPKKKGQHACRCRHTNSALTYSHVLKKELLLFDDSWF